MKARRDVSFRSLSFFRRTFSPLGNPFFPESSTSPSKRHVGLFFVDRVDLPPLFRAFKDEDETDS